MSDSTRGEHESSPSSSPVESSSVQPESAGGQRPEAGGVGQAIPQVIVRDRQPVDGLVPSSSAGRTTGRDSESADADPLDAANAELADSRAGDSAAAAPQAVSPAERLLADEQSQPYVGRWNELVSTTNWEKGRIILEWRDALRAAGAPVSEYSDEAWSQRVGSVTGQHAGRLRRVYQRFSDGYQQFPTLYWSHFYAALDWADAEMWLEGAVQSRWSVHQMRRKRWETLEVGAEPRPEPSEAIGSERDEDFEPGLGSSPAGDVESGPRYDGPDFGDADELGGDLPTAGELAAAGLPEPPPVDGDAGDDRPVAQLVQPFQGLPDLPDDLADALEAFQLAILAHKRDGWQAVARESVITCLEGLKQLVLAPSDEEDVVTEAAQQTEAVGEPEQAEPT